MSLADALRAPQPRKPCAVRKFVDRLEGDDRDTLEAALADTSVAHARIYNAVKEVYPDVYVPTEFTWGRHRRGGCSCERT